MGAASDAISVSSGEDAGGGNNSSLNKLTSSLDGLGAAITEQSGSLAQVAIAEERQAAAQEKMARLETIKLQLSVFAPGSAEHTAAREALATLNN